MFRGRIPGKPGLWAVETESTGSFPGARISRLACEDPSDRRQRCPWITPGLFDLQVNGIAGTSFTDPDAPPEALAAADALLRGRGISRYCPTVITRDRDTTRRALARLAQAMAAGHMSGAWGIHMEGPYISPEDGYRGVHRREFVRVPDWDEFLLFQAAAAGRVRIVTLAPELPGAEDFIRRAAASGITVSMGHTRASQAELEAAVGAGLSMSTHLFNGCAQSVDRHSNPLYSQLAADALFACFIADGHHVPAPALQVGLRAKGPGRSILVSDLAHLSGLPDGEYEMEGNRVVLRDGGIWVKGAPLLSGAARTLDEDVAVLARQPWPGIEHALLMACASPAAAVGERAWAELATGRTGPLAVFEWDGAGLALAGRAGF
jgi:N-acetylglucosamine-6-phosphate deacetylase